jgi:hypothetical protein
MLGKYLESLWWWSNPFRVPNHKDIKPPSWINEIKRTETNEIKISQEEKIIMDSTGCDIFTVKHTMKEMENDMDAVIEYLIAVKNATDTEEAKYRKEMDKTNGKKEIPEPSAKSSSSQSSTTSTSTSSSFVHKTMVRITTIDCHCSTVSDYSITKRSHYTPLTYCRQHHQLHLVTIMKRYASWRKNLTVLKNKKEFLCLLL